MTPKLYKAADVCEATGVQPYVLRSWEKEFPGIGVQRSPDSTRLYRESDIEQVRRIKQLVFGEGLTLAGARRRLEESSPRPSETSTSEMDEVLDTLGADARSRIDLVRSGLRSILEVLSKRAGSVAIPELPRNGSRVGGQPSTNGRKAPPHRRGSRRAGPSSSRRSGASGPPKSTKRAAASRGAGTRKTTSTKRKRAAQRF